ncbi:MAG: rod shape-determining protein MreC [Planctomycetaceae bacterium]
MDSWRNQLWIGWLLLAAGGAYFLPDDIQVSFRAVLGDLVRPGCVLWTETRLLGERLSADWRRAGPDPSAELVELREKLAEAHRQVRQLEIQLARLTETAAVERPPIFANASSTSPGPLAEPVLIPAGVLGESNATAWRGGRWLDQGKSAGLNEEAPLLTGNPRLLDRGRDAAVTAEDSLLLGRSVIGKVMHAGRWTSSFLLITDAGYRGRAQLVRRTDEGYLFGGKGVLKGTGESQCLLEGIAASESVEVGDSVYTAERDGILPTPLYYGKVVEATLAEGGREWKIRVEPVERPADLTTVEVLRTRLNLRRASAN